MNGDCNTDKQQFDDPITNLNLWSAPFITEHVKYLNDMSIEENERTQYVKNLAIKLFNKYRTDDTSISHPDYLNSLKEVSLKTEKV